MKTLSALFLCLLILVSAPVWGADFDRGVVAYESGDYATALREWTPLAEQGLVEAQYNLGQMYAKGEGVPQDYKEAVKWYRRAAEQGYASAQFNLGWMYRNGEGVVQDYVLAHMWWNIARKNGVADAGEFLNFLEKKMTSSQIAEAQKLARECVAKDYKGC